MEKKYMIKNRLGRNSWNLRYLTSFDVVLYFYTQNCDTHSCGSLIWATVFCWGCFISDVAMNDLRFVGCTDTVPRLDSCTGWTDFTTVICLSHVVAFTVGTQSAVFASLPVSLLDALSLHNCVFYQSEKAQPKHHLKMHGSADLSCICLWRYVNMTEDFLSKQNCRTPLILSLEMVLEEGKN